MDGINSDMYICVAAQKETGVIYTNTQNCVLNRLALEYNEGNEYALTDLLQLLEPTIEKEARKWGRKYHQGGNSCDDEFRSRFIQATWQAVEGYNGQSDFRQRFYFFLKQRGADLVKELKAKKRAADYESDSLYQEIGTNDNGESEFLIDRIAADDDVEDTVILKQMTVDFGEINRQQSQIVQLYMKGLDNNELARCLGASSYTPSVRKRVQRAKESFKKHLLTA